MKMYLFKVVRPDSIPAFVLKAAFDELAPILTLIYQTSLDTGQVPSEWRDAWVVPVFKKGEKHKAANYHVNNMQTAETHHP